MNWGGKNLWLFTTIHHKSMVSVQARSRQNYILYSHSCVPVDVFTRGVTQVSYRGDGIGEVYETASHVPSSPGVCFTTDLICHMLLEAWQRHHRPSTPILHLSSSSETGDVCMSLYGHYLFYSFHMLGSTIFHFIIWLMSAGTWCLTREIHSDWYLARSPTTCWFKKLLQNLNHHKIHDV